MDKKKLSETDICAKFITPALDAAGGGEAEQIYREIRVLLPPLAEQHRIVARVEELRDLCTQLRERLAEARRTQSQPAEALVTQAAA